MTAPSADCWLVVRTDDPTPAPPRIEVFHKGKLVSQPAVPSGAPTVAHWREIQIPLGVVHDGDVVRLTAVHGPWRSFHHWLVRRSAA